MVVPRSGNWTREGHFHDEFGLRNATNTMQMAIVINIRNLLIHNKPGDERNTVISRADRLIKPSSMKYALFPVSFLHPPNSVYLVMPLNSTTYGLLSGLLVPLTYRGRQSFTFPQRNAGFSSTHKLLNIVHPPAI